MASRAWSDSRSLSFESLLADLGHPFFQRRDRIGRPDAPLQAVVQQIAPVGQRLQQIVEGETRCCPEHQVAVAVDQGQRFFRLADGGLQLRRFAEQQIVLFQPPCFAHHVVHACHVVLVIDTRQQVAHLIERSEHQQHEQSAENDVAEQDLAVQGAG
jgi:hypothetical protein